MNSGRVPKRMPVGISARGSALAPEPEPEPEAWVRREGAANGRAQDLGDSLLSGQNEDVEQGREEDANDASPLSPVERLRRSVAQRRDAGVARLHALQHGIQAGAVATGGSRARCLFTLWLALLLVLLVGFSFLLAVNIDAWLGTDQQGGVILNDGGNTDVHHSCDDNTSEPQPGVGGCDCYTTSTARFREEWIEASELGQGHVLGDDDFFTIRLPFPFTFYGREFSGDDQIIMVSSNGYFTFGATHYKYGNTQTIPHDGVPDEMCAVYWSDFDPALPSDPAAGQASSAEPSPRVFTYFRQAEPRIQQPAAFVVEWADIAHFGAPSSACTFEAIVYDNGYISFLYQDITPTPNNWAAPSIGFEDARGTAGVQIAFNDPNWPPFGGHFAVSIPRSCHSPEANGTAPAVQPHHQERPDMTADGSCGLRPCDDHDPICATVKLVPSWCAESFGPFPGSMTMEDVTMNPKYRGKYATELCPLTCHTCEQDAARQRAELLEARARNKLPCSASAAAAAGCDELEECYEVGEGVCRTTQCECMSVSYALGGPQVDLMRDDCGVCALPPSLRDGLSLDETRGQVPSGAKHTDGSSRYPVWNADMDCAGQCHGTAVIDQCGSCAGGITTKVPGSMLGCDGQCFSSKQCSFDAVSSPIIVLVSATCIGLIMVMLVTSTRRRLVQHILAERQMQQGFNRERHAERTADLLRSLHTVPFDQDKEQLLQALGLPEDAELCNCSICLAEYEVCRPLIHPVSEPTSYQPLATGI